MLWFFAIFLGIVFLALIVGVIWISLPSKVLGDIEQSIARRKDEALQSRSAKDTAS
ncbi:MAG: hypothetical protein KDD69_05420 [Bdellovibrionales bacterium]|nr:hypothetical protein [Bdellovibrionales bacterium]